MLDIFYSDVPVTKLEFETNLKLIFLCSCALPLLREKEYGSDRLFSSSVNCHRFVFVGTICCFFKGMRGGLAHKMNW